MIDRGDKILVFGGSSFVGRHLTRALNAGEFLATYSRTSVAGAVRFDALSMRVRDILPEPRAFSHAVLLLGDTQPDSCFADPTRSRALNVDAIRRLIDDLTQLGIAPVFTSSEFVFDGVKGNYIESDIARPVLLYGTQKLEIEGHLAGTVRDFAILRLAKVYGLDPGDRTLFTGWHASLGGQRTIRCAVDQRFSPVFVGDVVAAILAVARHRLRGTYHVAGPVDMSRLELLELMLTELRRHGPVAVNVEPCSIDDFGLPERRPRDVSMRPDKLIATTGIEPTHPAEACRRICAAPVKTPATA